MSAAQLRPPVGIAIPSALPPAEVASVAALAEDLGFAELWTPEDHFYGGGFATAGAALAATADVPVGIGVFSAMVRHPAILAMEIATLAAAHPGRFLPGVGLGARRWLGPLGLFPRAQLAAVRECVTLTRSLLAGETVEMTGEVFRCEGVALTHPPELPPPIYCGVMGPNMLRLSGEVSDGTIVGATGGVEYVRWARARIADGQRIGGRDEHHRLVAYALLSVDTNASRAREAARPFVARYLGSVGPTAYTRVYGIDEELADMVARHGPAFADIRAGIAQEMPDSWVDHFAVAGDPEQCSEKLAAYAEAGADLVALMPVGLEQLADAIRMAGEQILTRLDGRLRPTPLSEGAF